MNQRGKLTVVGLGMLGIMLSIGRICSFYKSSLARISIGPNRVTPQISVSSGGCGSLYLVAPDGSLWGAGINPEFWDGLATVPRRIGTNSDWQAVAGTPDFLVALKTNGTLWQWGSLVKPHRGQVGTATNWGAISGGMDHVLALRNDGTLWAWGHNDYGQLGMTNTGALSGSAAPVQVGRETNWVSISSGGLQMEDGSCRYLNLALRRDGSLWAWGGYGPRNEIQCEPVQVGGETHWVATGARDGGDKGVKRDGSYWSWGRFTLRPNAHSKSKAWMRCVGGLDHNLVLEKDGSLWGWGTNQFGQVGDGTKKRYDNPKKIGLRTDWVAVGAAYYSSVGLTADGTLWGWGEHFWEPPKMGKAIELLKLSPIGPRLPAKIGLTDKFVTSSAPEPIAIFVPAANK